MADGEITASTQLRTAAYLSLGSTRYAATEIVKYYFQLHFGIKKDFRNHRLLERGNFYEDDR